MIKKMNVITRLLIIPAIIALTGLILAVPVSALVQLPHAFYGNVTINGEPAPIGTKIEARGQGIRVGISGNPIMTSEVGKYGSESETGVKLIVQGEGIEGNPVISFYINGNLADQTYTWQTGEITRLDLSVTISTTSGNGGGTSSPETSTLQFSLFGEKRSVSVSDTGEILESIEISSTLPSGKVTVSINAGTKALDKDGNPLTSLTSDANPTPPPAPEGSTVYIACNFGPDGATFDPPIVLTFEYSPGDIPENTDEEGLVIAFYDSSIGEWVPLTTEVDTVNHTVTASVSHFTSFAVLVAQVEPAPQETPSSISPTPSPEENPTPSPEENLTPPSQEPELTEPTPTPGPAPEEEPSVPQTTPASEQTEPNTNWNLYIIIAAVIIGGIVVGLLIRWTRLRNN
jgi:hypothetical protein